MAVTKKAATKPKATPRAKPIAKRTARTKPKAKPAPVFVPTTKSVAEFIASQPDAGRRADCAALVKMMREVTGEKPTLWGGAIVGFGKYHYAYASGHEGDACLAGFSPRKQALTVYLVPDFERINGNLLAKLGPHSTGKCCLYLKRLSDVDAGVLRELVADSAARARSQHG